MANCTIKVLKNPVQESQIDEAANILVHAFEGETLGRTAVDGNMDLLKPMFRAMARAAALEGALYAVYDQAGRMVTAGVWFPPGTQFMASETQKEAGWNDVMDAVSPKCRKWWKMVGEESDKGWTQLIGSKYNDCWYAAFIGTDPAYQGKGYGAAMVKDVLEKAARGHKVVILMTQSQPNVQWYGKLGFKLHKSLDFSGSHGNLPALFLILEEAEYKQQ